MAGRRRQGHFCWCCGLVLPNERFSGRGHARHICKACQRLGADELRLRQAIRDLDRILDRGGGRVRRRDRPAFERLLNHPDPRVREQALQIQEDLDEERRSLREEMRMMMEAEMHASPEADPWDDVEGRPRDDDDGGDVPF